LALLAFAAELLLFTYARGAFGPLVSPVLFLASSLLFVAAAWRALRDQPFAWDHRPLGGRAAAWRWVAATALLLVAFYPRLQAILAQYPVDIKMSDVLPVIEVYLRRFQNGEQVTAPITNFDYVLPAGYLPLMWMPFLIPDALNIDYRWVCFWSFGVGMLVYAYRLGALRPDLYEGAFKLLVPLLLVIYLVGADSHILGLSIESLVIGYYFVLVAGILSRSTALRATGLILCLLSRFALVLWVPLYLWLIYRHEGLKPALWLALLVLAGILGIYVIPFLSQDWTVFAQGQEYYTISAVGEWQNNLDEMGRPTHLYRGLGLAAFFHHYISGELIHRINALRTVHMVASAASVLVVAAWHWLHRRQLRIDYRYLALLALKINLAIFYAFMQVPYDNLLLLVVFMSGWVILTLRPAAAPVAPAA
jgi:hypothetical protein